MGRRFKIKMPHFYLIWAEVSDFDKLSMSVSLSFEIVSHWLSELHCSYCSATVQSSQTLTLRDSDWGCLTPPPHLSAVKSGSGAARPRIEANCQLGCQVSGGKCWQLTQTSDRSEMQCGQWGPQPMWDREYGSVRKRTIKGPLKGQN